MTAGKRTIGAGGGAATTGAGCGGAVVTAAIALLEAGALVCGISAWGTNVGGGGGGKFLAGGGGGGGGGKSGFASSISLASTGPLMTLTNLCANPELMA